MSITRTRSFGGSEIVYGDLVTGAIIDATNYDLVLPPGLWAIGLFINADGLSAGAITVRPLMPDGTSAEADAPELLSIAVGNAVGASLSIIDFTGSAQVTPNIGTGVCMPGNSGVVLWGGIRITTNSVAGAGATNRIWAVAVRLA